MCPVVKVRCVGFERERDGEAGINDGGDKCTNRFGIQTRGGV